MRKSNREITDFAEVEAVLRSAYVMRLALSVDDAPYVVSVNFGYVPGSIYFHCAPEGKKLNMLRANPRVAFEVEADVEVVSDDQPCRWTTRYRSVIGFGRALVVTDDVEKKRGMDVLMTHHGAKLREYDPKGFALATVVAVEIDSMTGKKLHRD